MLNLGFQSKTFPELTKLEKNDSGTKFKLM